MPENDHKYMKRCIELAAQAKSKGKTAVGSVLVLNNKIIAEAEEGEAILPDFMAHAENIVILKATNLLQTKNLSDCVLYTTVEPCFMCAYLIRNMKIKKVVYGTEAPAGGDSSKFAFLRDDSIQNWSNPPKVIAGVLREECEKILKKS